MTEYESFKALDFGKHFAIDNDKLLELQEAIHKLLSDQARACADAYCILCKRWDCGCNDDLFPDDCETRNTILLQNAKLEGEK